MQTRTAIPSMTVRELIALGRSPHRSIWKKSSKTDHEAIEWALDVTNSRGNENRMLHTLSGGERQKAYIAMALAQKTETIILDVPTTYLDIAHQLDLLELLKQLNETHGITILMVLHDLQQAAKYCDRLIAMKRGQVHQNQIGAPTEVLTEDFVNWTKSQAFGDAHAHGKAKPEGLLKNKITYYEVQVTRPALQKKA
ncbi:ATP-binding cassette domain-containing protein [Bacillus sp. A015]